MNTKNFKDFFSQQLNEPQQQAVAHQKGPLLVIAGAGSGKTRVITARIINLILSGIAPKAILALTFTNKAAGEMKQRIHTFVQGEKPFIGTFHAYCLYLLKMHADLLELPTFTILDADDQQQLLSSIIKRSGFEKRIAAKSLGYQISNLKNSLTSSGQLNSIDQLTQQLYREYEREKKVSKCLDFDDLLLETLKLFKFESFKSALQKTVRHILVDEYQDTNAVQHALLKALAQGKKKSMTIDSLCVVGDEDQSIYSWRGATVANILHFQKDFPGTTIIKIEQNYRSIQPILKVANHVIDHNRQRNPKKLWSTLQGNDRVRTLQCMSGYQEGDIVAHAAKQIQKKDKKYSFAVLYRAHYQSRTIEEALIRHSIPYTIIGGIQFYERKEIKDMLAFLRLIANPFDRISFFRVINCPARGLGDKFQEQFYALWEQQPFMTFTDIIKRMIKDGIIVGVKEKALESFLTIFANIHYDDKPKKALDQILAKTNYYSYLKNSFDAQEAEAKIENIKELIRATTFFEQNGILGIKNFLQEVALMQEKASNQKENPNAIKLMTLHAAKGLEFDMVTLTGLEEGIFPSNRSTHEQEKLEEERRLFYVGITRAKKWLLFTHARYRYTFGSMTDQLVSRFIREIPENLVPSFDTSYWQEAQFVDFYSDWFGTKTASSVLTFGTAVKNNIDKKPKNRSINEKKTSGSWKKNQPVKHKSFGVGIIKSVEKKGSMTTFITAEFKCGIKKIKSDFLAPL